MNPFSLHFSLLLFLLARVVVTGQNLIRDTCQTCSRDDANINLEFCITSLQAARVSRCANLQALGSISIWLTKFNVTDTRSHIKQLLGNNNSNKGFDPYVKACLNDCFELYSDAIPSIKQAMVCYNSKRYDDANIQISSVMDATTTCEDGFKEKGVVSPLTERNNNAFELSAIALSIMHMLQTGYN